MTAVLTGTELQVRKDIARVDADRKTIRIWLGVVIFTLFCLVLVGGATRLTDSGLSITQWKPIHGVIPPLSTQEWEEELELYRQIPQYQQINKGMSLDEFKFIFWWEWAHRLLARMIGVIFALPLAYFWIRGKVEPSLRAPLVGLLALGGLQGFIGWWMVSSGLSERTDVSQYRLAVHLMMACFIFASCVWIYRSLCPHTDDAAPTERSRLFAGVLLIMTFVQIYLGALVAGLDAGFTYNTWPLMDGAWVPDGLFLQAPAWINIFENPKTVQYIHRIGAYVLWAAALLHMIQCLRGDAATTHARRSVVLFVLISLQAVIGIVTLVTQVPLHAGVAHQGMALVVLAFAVAHLRAFYGERPKPVLVEIRD
ncbi:putative cytochrome C oxidase assembly transmembrane protein [Agrobacterium albertimagni AOL15]|uniref:Heme A synthase n=1 Tax=Agrobacterium albertimagni AOL15 TaxID=1156935 RepID=K2QBM6_9HYPH|nr:COX15/CtaA family protein [Agrobacterium albertimagni]EKF58461.1 putative cytochrome C oxidase assembly transmembrane protein [Agrobacterium albertimagni AOL15]